jgi:uncharacterized DUF497 family protein
MPVTVAADCVCRFSSGTIPVSVVSYDNTQKECKMPYFEFIWDEEPGGNVEHIAEHGLSIDDVEEVIFNPTGRDVSRSSGLPIAYGFTPDGRYILVVYEKVDAVTVFPVTAYEVEM